MLLIINNIYEVTKFTKKYRESVVTDLEEKTTNSKKILALMKFLIGIFYTFGENTQYEH